MQMLELEELILDLMQKHKAQSRTARCSDVLEVIMVHTYRLLQCCRHCFQSPFYHNTFSAHDTPVQKLDSDACGPPTVPLALGALMKVGPIQDIHIRGYQSQ